MRIDASRYNLFWQNPERYRLREIWKLQPIEPKPGTFASLLTYGRRRGTCFHELLDAAYRGVSEKEAEQKLYDDGFGEKEIDAAIEMAAKVREVYPNEEYLAHEVLFESRIPDSPHSLVGRIDHILRRDGDVIVGDWKTSKRRTKKDLSNRAADYCRSAQVGFYLLGAGALGFQPTGFLYRLVQAGDDSAGVEISEHPTNRTSLELKLLQRSVHQTCELIQFMLNTFGMEEPWPALSEAFPGGYEFITGRRMYEDFMPDGFERKKEHLPLMEAQ